MSGTNGVAGTVDGDAEHVGETAQRRPQPSLGPQAEAEQLLDVTLDRLPE